MSVSRISDFPLATLVELAYEGTTTAAMGFGLMVIILSSLCGMLGPGLALRGAEGANSVHKAVETMKEESRLVFKFFIAQLFFFHISSFLLMWVLYTPGVAMIVNIVLGLFLLVFIINGADIYGKLHLSEE